LIARLEQVSRRIGMIVQPSIENHPAISHLSNGALCTVRIVTTRMGEAGGEFLTAAFKMPVGGGVADNYAQGGLASPVDLTEGTIGAACSKKLPRTPILRHPDTMAFIENTRLPHWDQAIATARAAHRSFPDFVFLAWDIALTPAGPIIIEANDGWADLYQYTHNGPLGLTRFAEICAGRLAEKEC
jgi:hypothetical protein